jgi:hypothetical protein
MALINITPKMTSNTSPAPYVASASSEYGIGNSAWVAFDGAMTSGNCWATQPNAIAGWVQIDFSIKTRINAFSIVSRGIDLNQHPKDFSLMGSNDGVNFQTIFTPSPQTNWGVVESRLFELGFSVSFRYYKIDIKTNNGGGITVISEIIFWQEDGVTDFIENKKASLNYCLPKASTHVMKNRQNDNREGLLGFANDNNQEYGTLYMVDSKGQAIIPKASMATPTVLFDGNANAIGNYTLTQSIADFKYIIVDSSTSDDTANVQNFIRVNDIIFNTTTHILSTQITGMTYKYTIVYKFINTTTFNIYVCNFETWTGCKISRIIGIK